MRKITFGNGDSYYVDHISMDYDENNIPCDIYIITHSCDTLDRIAEHCSYGCNINELDEDWYEALYARLDAFTVEPTIEQLREDLGRAISEMDKWIQIAQLFIEDSKVVGDNERFSGIYTKGQLSKASRRLFAAYQEYEEAIKLPF